MSRNSPHLRCFTVLWHLRGTRHMRCEPWRKRKKFGPTGCSWLIVLPRREKRNITMRQEWNRVKIYCDPAVAVEHYTHSQLLGGNGIISTALAPSAAHLPTHAASAGVTNRYLQLPPERLGKRDRYRPAEFFDYPTSCDPSATTQTSEGKSKFGASCASWVFPEW